MRKASWQGVQHAAWREDIFALVRAHQSRTVHAVREQLTAIDTLVYEYFQLFFAHPHAFPRRLRACVNSLGHYMILVRLCSTLYTVYSVGVTHTASLLVSKTVEDTSNVTIND